MPDVTRSHADPAATGGDPTPAAASPPAHSRYTIGEEIARGGMGEVYRATDAVLNREVAVKVLQAKYAPTSVTARRFADEARITAQLQHPNIPAVHDLGTLPDGRPFLAMKLIKGNTLDTLLKARPDPTADRGRFVAVFEQIAHALAYAHAHGVLHRDLKPANVMVGAFNETQVMDWGLAKVLGERRDMHPPANEDEDDPDATRTPDPTDVKSLRDSDDLFTQAGSVLGTPAFMAPEQAIGAVDKIDRRSDVFGLGAILTVVLTGRPPFLGDSAESTRQLAAMGKVADCFALLDTCGAEPELVALCKWCLSTDPSDRPADAGEVATAVASLRAAADERARAAEIDREKATVQAAEQRKRRRVVQWAGVVTAAVLLAGVAGTAVGLFEARKQEAEATKQAGIAQENEAVAKRQELLARAETAKAKTATAAETVAKERAIKSRDQALGALRDTTSTDVELLLGEKKDLTANEKNYLEAIAKRWQAFAKQDGADEQSRVIQAEGHHRVG
ncbi:MAG: serine/threonine protein kinase, partial [Fimbriiglobus sp.]|nr:serine/threonine protein kinase [Fimbriiglobus sp.]